MSDPLQFVKAFRFFLLGKQNYEKMMEASPQGLTDEELEESVTKLNEEYRTKKSKLENSQMMTKSILINLLNLQTIDSLALQILYSKNPNVLNTLIDETILKSDRFQCNINVSKYWVLLTLKEKLLVYEILSQNKLKRIFNDKLNKLAMSNHIDDFKRILFLYDMKTKPQIGFQHMCDALQFIYTMHPYMYNDFMNYLENTFTKNQINELRSACMLNKCCDPVQDRRRNGNMLTVCSICKDCGKNECEHTKNDYFQQYGYKPSENVRFFDTINDSTNTLNYKNIYDQYETADLPAKPTKENPKIASYCYNKRGESYMSDYGGISHPILQSNVPYCTELARQYHDVCQNLSRNSCDNIQGRTPQQKRTMLINIKNQANNCFKLRKLNSSMCVYPANSNYGHRVKEDEMEQLVETCEEKIQNLD
jgi:hypothetical protein